MAMVFYGSPPLAIGSILSDGTIGANGIPIVFGETTIGLEGMAMVFDSRQLLVKRFIGNELLARSNPKHCHSLVCE